MVRTSTRGTGRRPASVPVLVDEPPAGFGAVPNRRLEAPRFFRSVLSSLAFAVSALMASQIGAAGTDSGIGSTTGAGCVRRVSASATATPWPPRDAAAGTDGRVFLVGGAWGLFVGAGGGVRGAGIVVRGAA